MGLLDEMQSESSRKGPYCGIAPILAELDPSDADELKAALTRPSITSAAIARVMAKRGYQVRQETVARHRRGECQCPK